jgi:hypothetical protein
MSRLQCLIHTCVCCYDCCAQVLDLRDSRATFGSGAFADLKKLKTLNLRACRGLSRKAVLTLPPNVTWLNLDHNKQIECDDDMLMKVCDAVLKCGRRGATSNLLHSRIYCLIAILLTSV